MASSPYKISHKSIVVAEYCSAVHYHECVEFVDLSNNSSSRRLAMTPVNVSYGVMQHYKPCTERINKAGPCKELLSNTIVDDYVLRYRQQLMENVRRVLDIGIWKHYNCSGMKTKR